jgi:arylsulfatase A
MTPRIKCHTFAPSLVILSVALAACASPAPSQDAGSADDATATDVNERSDAAAEGSSDASSHPDAAPAGRPNFIVLLAEASGWTSTSVMQDESIPMSRSGIVQTPSLDRIAGQGMRFSNFYAPSPRCMPTRASLLSGQSPAALHMTFIPEARNDGATTGMVIPPTTITTLPPSTPTVSSLLHAAGYATAHFGKWHAGNINPAMYGFDASDGPTSNRGPDNVDHPNPAQGYLSTDRAIAFMNAQTAAGRPFYVQVSWYGGKDEIDARPETFAQASAQLAGRNPREIGVAAVQMDMDINIGRLLTRLEELGIADNTYIFFTSDHGAQGPNSNLPLNAGKGSVWEGGIRVPFFVRGPIVRRGALSRTRTSGVDLLPTIATLAGVTSLPSALEGGSLTSVLSDMAGTVSRPREEFVVHFPHYDFDPLGPATTILLGDYKLTRFYETDSLRLFNLVTDLGETTDIAPANPTVVMNLSRRLDEYLMAVNAQMPTRR